MAEHLVAWTSATFGVCGAALALAGLTAAAGVCLVVASAAVGALWSLTREPTLRPWGSGHADRAGHDTRHAGARP